MERRKEEKKEGTINRWEGKKEEKKGGGVGKKNDSKGGRGKEGEQENLKKL